MRILLIGNFAPPFEEENLHNISLLKKLEDDGHQCSIINISENPSTDNRFLDASSMFRYVLKLVRHGWRKHVIHVSTKGYLRVGLLKLMFAVLIGTVFRAKTIITVHSEFFSVQGQMRSPFGGRQTLFTAFTAASKIICHDRDTYATASEFMKRSNFELIPSFMYVPDEINTTQSPSLVKLRDTKKVIMFSNVTYPSFVFEIINELISAGPLPDDTGLVISFADKPASKLQHALEESGQNIQDRLIFIDRDDIKAALLACSKAAIIIRPMSCDGMSFFENFSISVRRLIRIDNYIYFPGALLFIKEGDMASMCKNIINTILNEKTVPESSSMYADAYSRLKQIYEE